MTVRAAAVRYIKLGRGGKWSEPALARGELPFGYGNVTDDLARGGDIVKIKKHLVKLGRSTQAAGRDAREVLDFYQLGSDCLWITFAKDCLWWTFADPEVVWATDNFKLTGERMRKSVGGWRNTDINGDVLQTSSLSTRLTKVAAYRRTICSVDCSEYLLRKINGLDEPIIARNLAAKSALVDVLAESITSLHWRDFEILIDVVFSRSGWYRSSELGGVQKTVDLEIEQPTTNELAAVQIKSKASQNILDDYVERVDATGRFDRFFFVCHSPTGELHAPPERNNVHVWAGRELAEIALKLGLNDWVMERLA